MKPVKTIWIAAVLLSLAAGFWQRGNIQLIWREYSFLCKNFKAGKHYSPDEMYGLLVSPKLAKQDPEADIIARIWLGRFVSNRDQGIEVPAEKLPENPHNKFLLVELIRNICWRDSVIDPQITLKFADRLITLGPNNANYHYMKCYILLKDRQDNNIDDALRELERANACRDYEFPYAGYQKQAIDAANKAKFSRFLLSCVGSYDEYNFAANDLWKQLTGQSKMTFTNGDVAKGMRITDVLAKMQQCRIRNGDLHAIAVGRQSFSAGAYTSGYYAQPQGLELQRVNLTKERAREDRLQLCTLMTESIRLEKERLAKDMEAEKWKTLLFFALLPAVHAGEMFIAFLIGCLIIFLISAMRGFGEKNKIGLWGIFLFIAACVYYFYIVGGFVLVRLLFDKLGSPCSYSHFAYYEWLKPPPVFLYMDSTESVFVGSLIAGPIVAALVLWISSYIRPKKGVFWRFWYLRTLLALIIGGVVAVILAQINPPAEPEMLWSMYKIVGIFTSILAFIIITLSWWIFGWRITRLFLLTTFLGFVTLLAAIFRYAYYLPMIVFALTAPIIAVVKPNEGSVFKTIFRFFSSKPDVAAVRNKCLKLTVPFIAVYWLIFVALSPWVAKDIKLQTSEFLPTKQTVALSESNQAYRELMSMFDANGLRKEDICHRLGLVMPEDLPSVLQKLKHKSFADPYGYSPWSFSHATKQEKVRMEKQIERARRWNNDDLILAMNGCGRDTVGTITGFMDDPNSQWALVARAKLGDSSVKEKLKQLLQSSTQNGFADNQERQIDPNNIYAPSPPRTSEIIGAIACISMPDEAVQYFLDYVLNRDIYDLTSNDSRFFMGLSFLPTSQANAVIKTFLDKAIAWQPPTKEQGHYNPESVLYLLDNIIGLYGDEQIAQDVFKVMLLVAEDTKHFFKPHEISPYFTIESAPLLKQGLDSKNNDMRAWCVWQLRKVGYKFDKTELDKLMRDESWKVRANAAFAGGKEVASLAAKDKNALVRLVGGF